MIGVVSLRDALLAAEDAGLDLVEIAPQAEPPVCKILDYGKFKYEAQKKANEARKKQKIIEVKEIKLRPNIDDNDYDVKMRSARRFLEEGDKVKVTLRFRGREMAHQDLGMNVLVRVRDELEALAKVEQMPKLEGRQMVMRPVVDDHDIAGVAGEFGAVVECCAAGGVLARHARLPAESAVLRHGEGLASGRRDIGIELLASGGGEFRRRLQPDARAARAFRRDSHRRSSRHVGTARRPVVEIGDAAALLGVRQAVFQGTLLRLVQAAQAGLPAEGAVGRDGEGLVAAGLDIGGELGPVGGRQFRRRREGRQRHRDRRAARRQPILRQEAVDHRRPLRDGGAEEGMPVLAIRRCGDELRPSACLGEGLPQAPREVGAEEQIVLGIDPQGGNARRAAHRAEGTDQPVLLADLIVGDGAAAAGEADDRLQSRRRIGAERDAGEPAGRHAHRQDAAGIGEGLLRHIADGLPQILGALAGGAQIVRVVAGTGRFAVGAVRPAITTPHHRHHGPAAPRELARFRQVAQRRHLRPLRRVARRAVADDGDGVGAGPVRPQQHRLQRGGCAVGEARRDRQRRLRQPFGQGGTAAQQKEEQGKQAAQGHGGSHGLAQSPQGKGSCVFVRHLGLGRLGHDLRVADVVGEKQDQLGVQAGALLGRQIAVAVDQQLVDVVRAGETLLGHQFGHGKGSGNIGKSAADSVTDRAGQRGGQRRGVETAPAGGDVLVGADQVDAAGGQVVAFAQPAGAVHQLPGDAAAAVGNRVPGQRQRPGGEAVQRFRHLCRDRPVACGVEHGEAAVQRLHQPAGQAVALHRRVGGGGARHHPAGEAVAVRRVQPAVGVGGGGRQAAGIDQRAGEGLVDRQLQNGVAEDPAHLALRRDEVGGAGGVQDVLLGRRQPFVAVAVEQRLRRLAVQHKRQLPHQIVGVGHAAVGAAGAEGRDLMGAVAGEQDAAMAEPLQPAALEGVDRHPFQLERRVGAQHRLNARDDPLRLLLLLRVGIPAQLEIQAPDIVGLHVQQGRLLAVEGRVEPEPALRREIGLHHHVGDQEAVLEHLALELQPQHLAHRRLGAVAGDDPIGLDRMDAVRRFDLKHDMVGLLPGGDDAGEPAQVDQVAPSSLGDQKVLQVILLEVDKGGDLVVRLRQQVELVDHAVAVEDLADLPHDALVDHALADAQPVPHLQRALGVADGAAADADGVLGIQHHHRHALAREVEGRGQPDRAGADDRHRMAPDAAGALFVGGRKAVFRIAEGRVHWAFPPPETMTGRVGGLLLLPTIQFHLIPIKPPERSRQGGR
ncbi:hypothetical protein Lal_00005231 [Lupinus albus]|nr:hypothetical protein Lal_00005231 [Lupinus albus]